MKPRIVGGKSPLSLQNCGWFINMDLGWLFLGDFNQGFRPQMGSQVCGRFKNGLLSELVSQFVDQPWVVDGCHSLCRLERISHALFAHWSHVHATMIPNQPMWTWAIIEYYQAGGIVIKHYLCHHYGFHYEHEHHIEIMKHYYSTVSSWLFIHRRYVLNATTAHCRVLQVYQHSAMAFGGKTNHIQPPTRSWLKSWLYPWSTMIIRQFLHFTSGLIVHNLQDSWCLIVVILMLCIRNQ